MAVGARGIITRPTTASGSVTALPKPLPRSPRNRSLGRGLGGFGPWSALRCPPPWTRLDSLPTTLASPPGKLAPGDILRRLEHHSPPYRKPLSRCNSEPCNHWAFSVVLCSFSPYRIWLIAEWGDGAYFSGAGRGQT